MHINKVVVAGAGTMGSGIALTAALHGCDVVLYDPFASSLEKGRASIESSLNFLLSKQKLDEQGLQDTQSRITFTGSISDCRADLIIEAIVEDVEAKSKLFHDLLSVNNDSTILASNTSSLSISALQQTLSNPVRVAGMHFFNPAQVMKLVEVVNGQQTGSETSQLLMKLSRDWGKQPVLCKDAPGFIVNRVARPYYLESMYNAEHGHVDPATIDALLENAGFKMGPFKLMDLIGMDVNLAVSKSVYEAFDRAERFKPSRLQEEKVAAGDLGRKSGKGFYSYAENKSA